MNMTPSPGETKIPARSRRQAMDWSLALVSQGLQPRIEFADAKANDPCDGIGNGEIERDASTPVSQNDRGWFLVVPETDHAAALAIIRQYRLENLGWRRPVFRSGPIFDFASGAWVLLTLVFFWLQSAQPVLREAGYMNSAAVSDGQWWRLFTATLLHADVAHLASNAAFGLILVGLAMGAYGTGVGLLAAFMAGVGGNLAGWFVYGGDHSSLGASGVVMGALGLVAVQSAGYAKRHPRPLRLIAGGVFGGVMLFVWFGLSPGTDIVAHLGGFVSGLILGIILSVAPKAIHQPAPNISAGLIFTILVIATWLLALNAAAR